MHRVVILLRPRGLWLGHLRQEQKIAEASNGVTVAGIFVRVECDEEGFRHRACEAVVQGVIIPIVLTRPRSWPFRGVARFYHRMRGDGTGEPLRKAAVRELRLEQRLEPEPHPVVDR